MSHHQATIVEDVVTNQPAAAAMLANAPSRDRDYFKVPKIIE